MTPGYLLLLAAAISIAMAFAWLVQRRTGNSGWVDAIWSAATGLAAAAAIYLSDGDPYRKAVAAAAIAVWSLRLASHIGRRSKGAAEDPRYAALAEEWGDRLPARLFWFLQIQALAAAILVASVQAGVSLGSPFGGAADFIFILLAVVSLAGEALSDRQLAKFKRQQSGRKAICESGVWRYSRHPNYFFEWLFWCAWPLMALGGLPGAPLQVAIACLAPVMMYWLLVHVSGIPPLEAHMSRSRGAKFSAYQARVNAFFPGPRHHSTPRETLK